MEGYGSWVSVSPPPHAVCGQELLSGASLGRPSPLPSLRASWPEGSPTPLCREGTPWQVSPHWAGRHGAGLGLEDWPVVLQGTGSHRVSS